MAAGWTHVWVGMTDMDIRLFKQPCVHLLQLLSSKDKSLFPLSSQCIYLAMVLAMVQAVEKL